MALTKEISINYTNGSTQRLTPTMAALAKAEIHLAKEGLALQDASINGMLYAAYATLRAAGDVAMPYERWVETIESIGGPDDGEADEGKASPAA
ncbi:MAG: hypothetical protein UHS51_10620 [Atopobiaceae bacterium]|nr:hypothetical protein [Atopobiaceae bacterium]